MLFVTKNLNFRHMPEILHPCIKRKTIYPNDVVVDLCDLVSQLLQVTWHHLDCLPLCDASSYAAGTLDLHRRPATLSLILYQLLVCLRAGFLLCEGEEKLGFVTTCDNNIQ